MAEWIVATGATVVLNLVVSFDLLRAWQWSLRSGQAGCKRGIRQLTESESNSSDAKGRNQTYSEGGALSLTPEEEHERQKELKRVMLFRQYYGEDWQQAIDMGQDPHAITRKQLEEVPSLRNHNRDQVSTTV